MKKLREVEKVLKARGLEKMQELRQRLLAKKDAAGSVMINTIIRFEEEQNE